MPDRPPYRAAEPETPQVLRSTDAEAMSRAVSALAAGGIVGIPTDTVYGLAVLPLAEPLAALVAAKVRPPHKGIAVLVDDIDQVASMVVIPEAARRLAASYWPGPLTLLLPLRPGTSLPDILTGGGHRLGVRVSDHPVPRTLARRLGPLAVTSANLSGEPEASSAAQLLKALGASCRLIIDAGPVVGGIPSTVVSLAADGSLELLRRGAIDFESLQRTVSEPA